MSYLHPTAPVNTSGGNPDPFNLNDYEAANPQVISRDTRIYNQNLWQQFFQWKRISEDVIHFTPFDNLPPDQQLAIKARRIRAFKDSNIPWLVSDYTQFLTALDDIDDLSKSAQFLNQYVIKPVITTGKIARRLILHGPRDTLADFKETCKYKSFPRDRKLAIARYHNWNFLAFLGEAALALLFPSWRFVALGLQFLQTTDALFGVGLQLGPVLGLVAETVFRGLHDVGLPFGPENNKYHQLVAARVTQRAAQLQAAHPALHPEDHLTSLAATELASRHEFMPYMVITPDQYPDMTDIPFHPVTQLEHYAGLLASLPWNTAAAAVNNFLGPMLENWSTAVNGKPPNWSPARQPGSLERELLGLSEKGVCPGGACDAEAWQHLAIVQHTHERISPLDHSLLDTYHMLKNLLWDVPVGALTG